MLPHQAECIEEAKISISNTPLFLLRPVIPMGAGVPGHPLILAGQLNLSQPEEAHYAHHITTATVFSDLIPAMKLQDEVYEMRNQYFFLFPKFDRQILI